MNLLSKLQNPNQKLSKAAQKVSAVIQLDLDAAIHSSIASIASDAKVSEPTVLRFCNQLGCIGFPDFKLKLAQCIAESSLRMTQDVEPDDDLPTIIEKIFDSTFATLQMTQAATDIEMIEKATNALAQASSILFFGVGASGPVALDAQHKFFRINTPVIAHIDILNQRMTSASLSHTDVAVCISYTGRTIAMVETAKVARSSGAVLIGITQPNSPLAEQCDIVLAVETPEDTDLYTPMTSRIAHLMIIDVLVTAVALKRGPHYSKHLSKIRESFKETRIKQ